MAVVHLYSVALRLFIWTFTLKQCARSHSLFRFSLTIYQTKRYDCYWYCCYHSRVVLQKYFLINLNKRNEKWEIFVILTHIHAHTNAKMWMLKMWTHTRPNAREFPIQEYLLFWLVFSLFIALFPFSVWVREYFIFYFYSCHSGLFVAIRFVVFMHSVHRNMCLFLFLI